MSLTEREIRLIADLENENSDLEKRLRATLRRVAEQDDIGFRRACGLVQDRLRECASQLRKLGQDAYDEGYPERKLAWMEASTRVLTEARAFSNLETKKPSPGMQASLDLEKAS